MKTLAEIKLLFLQCLPTIVGVVLWIWLPIQIVLAYLRLRPTLNTDVASDSYTANLPENVASIFATILVEGSVLFLLAARKRGEFPTVNDSISAGFRWWWPLLLISIFYGLTVVLGMLGLIIPGLIFVVRFAFAPLVVVFENIGGRSAMKRSWQLTQGNWGRVSVFLLGWVAVYNVAQQLTIHAIHFVSELAINSAIIQQAVTIAFVIVFVLLSQIQTVIVFVLYAKAVGWPDGIVPSELIYADEDVPNASAPDVTSDDNPYRSPNAR